MRLHPRSTFRHPTAALVALIAGLLLPDPVAAAEPPVLPLAPAAGGVAETARPWAVGAEAGAGLGFFFATYGKLGLTLDRRLARHLALQAAFQLDLGRGLVGLEETLGAALVLPLPARWEIALGWRVGAATFRAALPVKALWTTALAVSVLVEARYPLSPSVELRIAPVTATGYWDTIWGFVLTPSLGAAWRFF